MIAIVVSDAQGCASIRKQAFMEKSRLTIVTGAGQGIGYAIARRLAEDGKELIIVDVSAERADTAAHELTTQGFTAHSAVMDVSDPYAVQSTITSITDTYGPIGALVNNAGIVSNTPWNEVSFDEWYRVIAINLSGSFLLSQAVLPSMIDAGYGRIVNIVSLAGRNGGVSVGPAYAASKAGVIGLTRHLAGKVAASGVTVNAVAPGTTRTPMAESFTPEQMEAINRSIPVGRLGETGEIAEAVAYFTGENSGFTTGAVLDVNGGMYFG